MKNQRIFNTLNEVIEYIIGQLKDNVKKLIKHGEPIGVHMALNRWIKNEYVFSRCINI